MPTVLITGANRGLGLEFAIQYAADGWRVLATCRDISEAGRLKEPDGDIKVLPMDVTDHGAIESLAHELRREAIDLLVNNVGIYGPRPCQLGGIDYAAWDEVMRINTLSAMKVAESFVDHIARSDKKIVAAISSKMGSITGNSSGGSYIYRSSKAALNAVMKSLAVDMAPKGVIVAVFHPGWVRTDMGGPSALIDASESVSGIRTVIDGLTLEKSGRFFNYDGTEISW